MNPSSDRLSGNVFDLPERLAAKADPRLVGEDESHFAAIAESLEQTVTQLSERLDAERAAPVRMGQEALERDLEIHRLTGRLRALRRFGLDLCLGHFVPEADTDTDAPAHADARTAAEPIYVGRLGLTDASGRRLLVDWRSPAAEPFFAATRANPMGVTRRRRYRWTGGWISDYWDEVLVDDGVDRSATLDDESAFIAGLSRTRTHRMQDVLATIQADQDAIIRARSRGALVVDGGPGTGKTVVALHRTAYLLYADPRLGQRHGGVLSVGPSQPYLAYVADVLPSLGEEGVRTCTLRELVPEGATAGEEADPEVARLKASADLVGAVERAVTFYEELPTEGFELDTGWGRVWVSPGDWAEAFEAVEAGMPHNEARDEVLEAVVAILADKLADNDGDDDDEEEDEDLDGGGDEGDGREEDRDDEDGGGEDDDVDRADRIRASLRRSRELLDTLNRAWPIIEPTDLVADLWTVPAYLRLCAPWLTPEEVRRLRRSEGTAWTTADLPYLDAARRRLGDPQATQRARRIAAGLAAQREEMDRVVDHLVATDDSEMHLMSMLRGADLQQALVDDTAYGTEADVLAGPFAHVVVDEAQELTDAEWQLLLARCPSRSLTIVGDRAQARHGFTESWQDRLERLGLVDVRIATLGVNYRTPEEVMEQAAPVIREAIPDANVPTSIRRTGIPVRHGVVADRDTVLEDWLAAHPEGVACVIGDPTFDPAPEPHQPVPRVRSLSPQLAKGLEFDLVVLVDPETFGAGIEGAVDRYVAMTRATQELVVLTSVDGGAAQGSGAQPRSVP